MSKKPTTKKTAARKPRSKKADKAASWKRNDERGAWSHEAMGFEPLFERKAKET